MEEKRPEEKRKEDWYALPLIGGAVAGFLIGGLTGAIIGGFVVDVFRDLRGTRRLAAEMQRLIQEASNFWDGYRRTLQSRQQAPATEESLGQSSGGAGGGTTGQPASSG